MKYHIGIDPGANGAIAFVLCDGSQVWKMEHAKSTEHDLAAFLASFDDAVAYIEQVHAMPKQGVSSTFKFGRSYGFMIGLLTAHKIPFREVTPRKWQSELGCLSKGDKNVTKAAAQRLFPDIKVTHANADALLIAEYCRRVWV